MMRAVEGGSRGFVANSTKNGAMEIVSIAPFVRVEQDLMA
jgi:hypothetical protein